MDQNILITTSSFGKIDKGPLQHLKEMFSHVVLNPYSRKLTEDEVEKLITEYQPVGLIAGVEPLTERVLQKAENLKVISRAGIGMDKVDLKSAQALNIIVVNTPDAPTIPVAELTIGMMISLLRMIHRSDQGIRSGNWVRPMGQLLHGKTVGLIGCGRIGQCVAKILNGFGCEVIGHDPVLREHEKISFIDLETLLKSSDIVSLHLPYSEQTRYLINEDTFELMKKGSYLINSSRGGLVDEKALYEALDKGKLAGAALDSFEDEPYNGPLTNLDNILLTGHIGSYAREGRALMEEQAAQNLIIELEKKGLL